MNFMNLRRAACWLFCGILLAGFSSHAAEAKILKVLPQYVDKKGRTALSPSLFDRDAYQSKLRRNPELASSMVYRVNWKSNASSSKLVLRVEVRTGGANGKILNAEQVVVRPKWGSRWTDVGFTGDDFVAVREAVAWRVTLLEEGRQVAEQKSFLW
jgi:hypothetical protein